MHTRRPARLKHLSYIDIQRYSLTFCTDRKRRWFENAGAVELVLYYEHVLRDDEKLQVIARYILENAVRAGLAQTVTDYPFAGSLVYDVKELVATLPVTK